MPKKPIKKVPIDKKATIGLFKEFKVTIKDLATHPELNCNEKTIRRALNDGMINPKYMKRLSDILMVPVERFQH